MISQVARELARVIRSSATMASRSCWSSRTLSSPRR